MKKCEISENSFYIFHWEGAIFSVYPEKVSVFLFQISVKWAFCVLMVKLNTKTGKMQVTVVMMLLLS